jgi:hypothetical protein
MVDKDLHALPSIHGPAGVDIDCTTSVLRECVNAYVAFCQGVHNCDTLRLELMGEPIENGGAARFNRLLEGGTYAVKIIQQME